MTRFIISLLPALIITGCQTGIGLRDPAMTKKEVVSRIGLPAEIYLGIFSGSAPEMWTYYEEDPTGKVSAKIIGFKDGRIQGIPSPNIIPERLLNPDKPKDFAKIAAYQTRLQYPSKH